MCHHAMCMTRVQSSHVYAPCAIMPCVWSVSVCHHTMCMIRVPSCHVYDPCAIFSCVWSPGVIMSCIWSQHAMCMLCAWPQPRVNVLGRATFSSKPHSLSMLLMLHKDCVSAETGGAHSLQEGNGRAVLHGLTAGWRTAFIKFRRQKPCPVMQ